MSECQKRYRMQIGLVKDRIDADPNGCQVCGSGPCRDPLFPSDKPATEVRKEKPATEAELIYGLGIQQHWTWHGRRVDDMSHGDLLTAFKELAGLYISARTQLSKARAARVDRVVDGGADLGNPKSYRIDPGSVTYVGSGVDAGNPKFYGTGPKNWVDR